MKAKHILFITLLALLTLTTITAQAQDNCQDCHATVTPGIVEQHLSSEHSVNDVTCVTCHEADTEDPSGYSHGGATITPVVSPNACITCHPDEVEEYSRSKHAWTTFIGPLKPWYRAMVAEGLDPLDQQTAIDNNPEEFIKDLVTPLFPDSGALKKAGILDSEDYNHENQILGCEGCHGTYVTAKDGEILDGWPNTGVGRVNPDGSLGSCASCHTRHAFSIEEARKPETCGQCHMGPDHPQIEIYEESKHGNIYASSGEEWDWSDEDWGADDILAPTCATCHMSGFNGVVETTHDAGERLYWELQPKKSVMQWDDASLVPLGQQSSDAAIAEQGRSEMTKVCNVCHSSAWTDGYFESFDKVVSDYNMVYDYTFDLLNTAYDEDLISNDNPIDEIPEVMYYYIWHHDGRRWRMGASMMAPDWLHWGGAVDALMDKLNTMEEWIKLTRTNKALQEEIDELSAIQTATDDNIVALIQAQESTQTELEALKNQSDGTDEPPDSDNTILYLIGAIAVISLAASGYLITKK